MSNYTKAVINLSPISGFILRGDDEYANIEWCNPEENIPTEVEVSEEVARLDLLDSYQVPRAQAYPPMADQLDDIFHNGVDGWKATIQAVKDAHPKPV